MPRFSVIDDHGWVVGTLLADNAQIASDCFNGLTAIDTTNEVRNPYHGSQYVDGAWVFPPLLEEGVTNA